MAANDEFPRGWTLSNRPAVSAQAVITVPAIVGVSHILTDVLASGFQAGAVGYDVAVTVTSGGTNLYTLTGNNPILELGAPATLNEQTISTFQGKVVGLSGGNLVVSFNGAVTNLQEMLVIQGYDI